MFKPNNQLFSLTMFEMSILACVGIYMATKLATPGDGTMSASADDEEGYGISSMTGSLWPAVVKKVKASHLLFLMQQLRTSG